MITGVSPNARDSVPSKRKRLARTRTICCYRYMLRLDPLPLSITTKFASWWIPAAIKSASVAILAWQYGRHRNIACAGNRRNNSTRSSEISLCNRADDSDSF